MSVTEEQRAAVDARRAGIVRLLETRHEHLPEPVRRSEAAKGFVHRAPARVSCPDCLANDRTMFGCETCGGRGYTETVRERDPYAVDKVMPYGMTPDRRELEAARDRQIKILDQQLRPASTVDEAEDAKNHPYAWERARARMYQAYDYAMLDLAIEWLRGFLPGLSLYGGLALGFFDTVLPERLRVPGDEPEKHVRGPLRPEAGLTALAIRDEEMRQAADRGASVTELCTQFGVSKSTVYAVVNRRDAAA